MNFSPFFSRFVHARLRRLRIVNGTSDALKWRTEAHKRKMSDFFLLKKLKENILNL